MQIQSCKWSGQLFEVTGAVSDGAVVYLAQESVSSKVYRSNQSYTCMANVKCMLSRWLMLCACLVDVQLVSYISGSI